MKLKLAYPLDQSVVALQNGPGFRWTLWTQGCSLLCTKNCINQHMLTSDGGYAYNHNMLLTTLDNVIERQYFCPFSYQKVKLEGITLLGGEPTDQAEALEPLLKECGARGLSTMLYTGYTLKKLLSLQNKSIEALLAQVDILVDGPFRQSQEDQSLMWRGSSNQKIHLLTSRYTMLELQARFRKQGKGITISTLRSGDTTISGVQSKEISSTIEKKKYAYIPIQHN